MNRFALAVDMDAVNYDPSLQLVRWRDPATNRFITYDSFQGSPSDPMHLHKYVYAGNNPVTNTDPSGHDFGLGSLLTGIGISVGLTAIGGYYGNKLTHSVRGTIWGAAAGLGTGLEPISKRHPEG